MTIYLLLMIVIHCISYWPVVIVVYGRIKIAHEFANTVKSEDIIKIILFGSVARGDDTQHSDIDILIICNQRDRIQDKVDDEIAWIMYDKGELVSAHIMTEDLFNKTKNFSFLTNVLREGITIG